MADLHDLGAAEAVRGIRSGALSPVDLLNACLKRIDATEAVVKAWVHLDRERALTTARQREMEAREGRFLGALHGVPFALKDIVQLVGGVFAEARLLGAAAWCERVIGFSSAPRL
jgi:aspartyl-tRNA(Asn)/glutamyl-tRNA(Gln) amidotransferase subunit A